MKLSESVVSLYELNPDCLTFANSIIWWGRFQICVISSSYLLSAISYLLSPISIYSLAGLTQKTSRFPSFESGQYNPSVPLFQIPKSVFLTFHLLADHEIAALLIRILFGRDKTKVLNVLLTRKDESLPAENWTKLSLPNISWIRIASVHMTLSELLFTVFNTCLVSITYLNEVLKVFKAWSNVLLSLLLIVPNLRKGA